MIKLICAMDLQHGIGLNGKMPWHFPEDLKYFKNLTLNQTVLMGRKTFESIGNALPDRKNIILTHQSEYNQPDCIIVHSLEDALNIDKNLFVIGGQNLFEQTLPIADELYLTEIHQTFEADTFFPQFDASLYHKEIIKTTNEPFYAEFIKYSRIKIKQE